jgi:uncharacterized membrane protein YtjA (UPF0391 family)
MGAGSNGERYSTGAAFSAENRNMMGWAATFLVIAVLAAVLGVTGVAGVAIQAAWILFVVGLVLAVIVAIGGRRRAP